MCNVGSSGLSLGAEDRSELNQRLAEASRREESIAAADAALDLKETQLRSVVERFAEDRRIFLRNQAALVRREAEVEALESAAKRMEDATKDKLRQFESSLREKEEFLTVTYPSAKRELQDKELEIRKILFGSEYMDLRTAPSEREPSEDSRSFLHDKPLVFSQEELRTLSSKVSKRQNDLDDKERTLKEVARLLKQKEERVRGQLRDVLALERHTNDELFGPTNPTS